MISTRGHRMNDSVIRFPKQHAKAEEVSDLPLNDEELAQKLKMIRLGYYAEVADELLDILSSKIGSLNLNVRNEEAVNENFPKDILLMREVLIGMMCRFSDTDYPTHQIFDMLFDLTEEYNEDLEEMVMSVKVKSQLTIK